MLRDTVGPSSINGGKKKRKHLKEKARIQKKNQTKTIKRAHHLKQTHTISHNKIKSREIKN